VLRQRASHAIQRCCVVLPYSLRAPSPAPCATTSAIIRVLPISLSAAAASVLVSSLAAPREQPRGVVRAEGGAAGSRDMPARAADRIGSASVDRGCHSAAELRRRAWARGRRRAIKTAKKKACTSKMTESDYYR
jgi:hypothetical protein